MLETPLNDDSRLNAHVRSILRNSGRWEGSFPDAADELLEHALLIVTELEEQGVERGRAVDEAIRRLGDPGAIGAAYHLEGMRGALLRALELPRAAIAAALADVALAATATFRDAPVVWSFDAVVSKLLAVGMLAVGIYAGLIVLGSFALNQLRAPASAQRVGSSRLGAIALACFTMAAWLTTLPGATAILVRRAIESQVHVAWPVVALIAGVVASASAIVPLARLPYRVW